MAGVLLKRYVQVHWDTAYEHFEPPQTDPRDKEAIRAALPQGLADPESKIRTAAAVAIASIAHWDWPREWPGLIEELVKCLATDNTNLMDGAIRCLEMFASGDNMSDEHLPELIPRLFPLLLRVFSSEGYPERVRARAGSIFYACLEWVAMIEGVHPETLAAIMPYLPEWVGHFAQILAAPMTSAEADYSLKIVVLQILTVLVLKFPRQVGAAINNIVPHVYNSLLTALKMHEEFVIEGEGIEVAQDEEGDVRGLEMLIMLLLDFVRSLLLSKPFKKVFSSALDSLCRVLISYMRITHNQEESWLEDPNEYVADEDDEIRFNARAACTHLLQDLMDQFGRPAAQGIARSVGLLFAESRQQQQSGNPSWWKLREASVLAMGATADALLQLPGSSFIEFIESVLLPDIQTTASPFLRGRAMWCAAQFSQAVPADKSLPFIRAAVEALQAPQEPLLVKICACRALASYCPKLEDAGLVAQMVVPTVQGLVGLLGQTTEETLHLTLETLEVVLAKAGDTVRPYVEALAQQLVRVWDHHINDPLITSDVQDCLRKLVHIPECAAMLKGALLPYLLRLIGPAPAGQEEILSGAREAAMGLLTTLVYATSDMQPTDPLLLQAFPLVVQQLMGTDDHSLLNEGSACLSAFVSRAPALLLQWNDGRGGSGISYVLQFVGRLLQPSTPDMAALYVGPLVTKLVAKVGAQVGTGTLTEMLKAVLARMQTPCIPSLKQSLLLVFVRLMMGGIVPGIGSIEQTREIREFLRSLPVGDGTDALTLVFQTLAKQMNDIHGSLNIKASVLCLLNLFCLQDQQLLSLPVEGDVVVPVESGRSTRSKGRNSGLPAEKRQVVPLAVKALKGAVQELMIVAEQAEGGGADDDDSDSDEGQQYQDEMKALMAEMGEERLFMDQLLDGNFDEEEKEDPDCVNDPLYQLDLKAWLENFLQQFATQSRDMFGQLANMMQPLEQQFLVALLKRLQQERQQ